MPRVSLPQLPDDVLCAIAGHLIQRDRARLARACKAFKPLLLCSEAWLHISQGLGGDAATHAFNCCLKSRRNRLYSLCVASNATPDWDHCRTAAAVQAGAPAYRFLLNLTKVHLYGVEVHLPALACIRQQLRHVKMCECLLMSFCWPAAGTNAFALGWDKLEELNLSRSSIDTHILAVSMPKLQQLKLKGFTIKDDAGEALNGSMEAFALGCPVTTDVEFEPVLRLAPAPFKNFVALERLQLAFDPVYLREVEVQWDDKMKMPSSLTALECMSSSLEDLEDWEKDAHRSIRLPAALSVAAACISAGAPLHSLTLAHCRTVELMQLVHEDVALGLVEPDEEEVVQLYRPLATALQGLVHLDLCNSADCSGHVVNELVASAPSLRSLMLRLEDPGFAHNRELVCSGLEEVHVEYQVFRAQSEGAAFAFTLLLVNTAALRSCMLEVLEYDNGMLQGDSIIVMLGCHEEAGIDWSVECMLRQSLLGFEVHVPEGAEGMLHKQATLSYVYEKDEDDWTCAVEE